MAKRHRTYALAFVHKHWYDTTLRFLATDRQKSGSTLDLHVVIAPVTRPSDPAGLWVEIQTPHLLQDGSETTAEFMIPWRYIHALALHEQSPRTAVGFQPEGIDSTVLTK